MYLARVRAKNNVYLYLKAYAVRAHYTNNKKIVFRFGKEENALKNMYEWLENKNKFPKELIDLDCRKDDLLSWIRTIETGKHQKTGRSFKKTFT